MSYIATRPLSEGSDSGLRSSIICSSARVTRPDPSFTRFRITAFTCVLERLQLEPRL
jgi:hypothetical protein